jgi:hypothetical protein
MKTRVYSIDDEDVLDTFFGEDSMVRPVTGLGQDHGELIFEGPLSGLPVEGDVFVQDDDEYVVLLRIFHAESDEAELVVHRRHFEGGQVS